MLKRFFLILMAMVIVVGTLSTFAQAQTDEDACECMDEAGNCVPCGGDEQ